jgi:uncharacterized protein (DUF433 family)
VILSAGLTAGLCSLPPTAISSGVTRQTNERGGGARHGFCPLRVLAANGQRVYSSRMSRIQVRSDVHFGKPCITGTRIPVQAVLERVRDGIPFETIVRDYYPDITPEDIQACVQYAIDVVQNEDLHLSIGP